MSTFDLYTGRLDSALPRLAPFLNHEGLLPWAQVWLRFFYASIQFSVGDADLEPKLLQQIADDAEAIGLIEYQAASYRELIRLLITIGERHEALELALRVLEQYRKAGQIRGQAAPLIMAVKACVYLGDYPQAHRYFIQLEPIEHYLWQPQAVISIQLEKFLVREQLGTPCDFSALDQRILANPAHLFRARHAARRSEIAAIRGNATEAARWKQTSRESLDRLVGGCPLDLQHLL